MSFKLTKLIGYSTHHNKIIILTHNNQGKNENINSHIPSNNTATHTHSIGKMELGPIIGTIHLGGCGPTPPRGKTQRKNPIGKNLWEKPNKTNSSAQTQSCEVSIYRLPSHGLVVAQWPSRFPHTIARAVYRSSASSASECLNYLQHFDTGRRKTSIALSWLFSI